MNEWREAKHPEWHWAPGGLPGWLKAVPGWAARGYSEAAVLKEATRYTLALAHHGGSVGRGLPHGGGRPVLVVPGFGFGDGSTVPLQLALKQNSYTPARSQIVANVRCSDRTVQNLGQVAARAVAADGGRRLLVVGHSRGGMIARGLAVRYPELVDRVISLGAPLNYEFAFYEVPQPLVEALRVAHWSNPALREMQCATPDCSCPYMQAAHRPLPQDVDLVSIYTKADGIVDWRACVVPGAKNIEVPGSHLGMGMRPDTLRTVLRELGEPSRRG